MYDDHEWIYYVMFQCLHLSWMKPNANHQTHLHSHTCTIEYMCMASIYKWNVRTNICKWMMVQTKYLMARWWCSNTASKYLCWICVLNQYTWIYEVHGWYMRVCTYVYIHAYINDVNVDIRLQMCACVKARQRIREKEGVRVRYIDWERMKEREWELEKICQ